MQTILKGHIIGAPSLGELSITENGYLVLEDGVLQGVFQQLPESFRKAAVTDFGDRLILQSFSDMHLHGAQYPMLGLGMDLPLLDWLDSYAFPVEARFSDASFARRVYRRLANALIENGTTRVCMFASLHTDTALILMEELEQAGVTGYVGKVNMDRNGGAALQETTEESKRETLRFLDGCRGFRHVRPILTPRFTPSCTDELMAWLGALSNARDLPVQSHLSENDAEMALVGTLHPDCGQYWETYAKYGLFHERTVMAHCVHSDANERAALRRHGVLAVHCPDSNINICSGFAPVRQMLQEGVQVALGSDIAGGALLPMNRVVTAAIRASKARSILSGAKESFLTVAEGYYLGTTAGARFFGAGAGFRVGDPLHAIVVDENRFPEPVRPLSLRERFERAMYLMQPENIVACYSEGRRVKS